MGVVVPRGLTDSSAVNLVLGHLSSLCRGVSTNVGILMGYLEWLVDFIVTVERFYAMVFSVKEEFWIIEIHHIVRRHNTCPRGRRLSRRKLEQKGN